MLQLVDGRGVARWTATATLPLPRAALAARAVARLGALSPGFDFERYAGSLPIVHPAAVASWRAGLRRLAAAVGSRGGGG